LHIPAVGDKLGEMCIPISKVIHRGVESREILAYTADDLGGPKGKISEIS
jgi:hypothetical protein